MFLSFLAQAATTVLAFRQRSCESQRRKRQSMRRRKRKAASSTIKRRSANQYMTLNFLKRQRRKQPWTWRHHSRGQCRGPGAAANGETTKCRSANSLLFCCQNRNNMIISRHQRNKTKGTLSVEPKPSKGVGARRKKPRLFNQLALIVYGYLFVHRRWSGIQ